MTEKQAKIAATLSIVFFPVTLLAMLVTMVWSGLLGLRNKLVDILMEGTDRDNR